MPARQLATVWLQQQRLLKADLNTARATSDGSTMREAVSRAMARYEAYFRARAETVRGDPVRFYCEPWVTRLERGTHWIAGWRPSAVIHLLYSESGIRFQAQLGDLLVGIHSGDLGDLSPRQLERVDEVQRRTIGEEGEIEDELRELQEGLGDLFPVMDADLEEKMGKMEGIIRRADGLRMKTLKDVVDILEPAQAVIFWWRRRIWRLVRGILGCSGRGAADITYLLSQTHSLGWGWALCRALCHAHRLKQEDITVCAVFADCRKRLSPPMSENYFRNLIHATFTVGPSRIQVCFFRTRRSSALRLAREGDGDGEVAWEGDGE